MRGYAARRLPGHDGPAAWAEILAPALPPRPLEGERTADIVVVGAGFAGLSAARRATQLAPGAQVAVLEAGRVAEGAAGRNTGFMIDPPHDLASEDYAGAGDDRAVIARNRLAIAFAAEAVEEYGIAPAFFDRAGKINGAASAAAEAHNASYARHLRSLGEPFETRDAADMRHITGSPHYSSGLYTPGTVMLQPAGYVRGLAAGLAHRAAIHEHSPVTGFARRGRLMQVFLFASMTRELDAAALARLGGAPRWGVTPSDPMGSTMRRIDTDQGGNRIVTRTAAARGGDMRRAAALQRRKFDERFPQIAGFPMEHCWAGHLCLSLNGVSVTREIDEGVFSACVQNGLGTARGTLTGIAAAEMALGHRSELAVHFAAEPRPRRLPPPPLGELGANAVLRWREWRAGPE